MIRVAASLLTPWGWAGGQPSPQSQLQ